MIKHQFQFTDLEKLRRFLSTLRGKHVPSLSFYFDRSFAGFHHKYEKDKKSMSKSSTSTCILSLVRTGGWRSGIWEATTDKTVTSLLEKEWESAGLEKDNPFTVSFVLEAVEALRPFVADLLKEAKLSARVKHADAILVKSLSKGAVSLIGYPPTAYLTQLVVRVLNKRGRLTDRRKRDIVDWAWREIDHQLALLLADSKTADLFQLIYSIILTADIGDPAEATPDQSLILRTALDQFFERQLDDGTWPRSRSLFHYPGVGSAYCYEYEMLSQLLECLPLRDRLLRYLDHLSKAAYALEDTSYKLSNDGLGWTSGHHPQLTGPESWSTASVYHFTHGLDRLVAEAIRRSVFEELDALYFAPSQPKTDRNDFAPHFLDCPLKVDGKVQSLKAILFDKFVKPIAGEARKVEEGGSLSAQTPMSAIFFGPPGTSKTELTMQIADFLNWPRLTVDPSYFVKNGMDLIQTEADRLFNMLSASERIVVLLDEFDEMVRDRAQSTEILSRFLTTAMLPKLATINKSRRIVFIVNTNYIDEFDLAISRRGRFDMIVQVMPPTMDAKLAKWPTVRNKLREFKLSRNKNIKEKLGRLTFDEFQNIEPRLSNVKNAIALRKVIETAEASCILSTKYEQGKDKTWATVSVEQGEKVRLPIQF